MDNYPAEYVDHELPLIALSGLVDSSTSIVPNQALLAGTSINIELPELPDLARQVLKDEIYRAEGSSLPWNATANSARPGLFGFRFKCIGRKLTFPRRKAAPAAQAPSDETQMSPPLANVAPPHELHSTLSPLSPTSPLYPDGLMSPHWLGKHQQATPSVLLCFFELGQDPTTRSLHDNKLKTEINGLKTALLKSGHRTRLAVVLVSNSSSNDTTISSELEDRVQNIRRATGLDSKTAFFHLPSLRVGSEVSTFVFNLLSALQPVCNDYYRELTKHARRKSNRSSTPSIAGSLSNSGWRARYEFKLGIFAEFRQEMDVADRHFVLALDELFHSEGVLGSTPIWSNRWTDARILSDAIALRVIRCQLWRGLTSQATESWLTHRNRVNSLITSRGKGTETYGYAAWESRWSEIMAQLIRRSKPAAFEITKVPIQTDDSIEEDGSEDDHYVVVNITAPPEKSYPAADRIPPFQLLHHAGYWYRLARRWALERYERAKAIPTEDRTPPGSTPASKLADRSRNYDLYMVPMPHDELPENSAYSEKVSAHILELDDKAAAEFEMRKQFRLRSKIVLDKARLLAEQGNHQAAFDVLVTIYDEMSWRSEGWWHLAGDVILALFACTQKLESQPLLADLQWELSCLVFQDLITEDVTTLPKHDTSTNTAQQLTSARRLSPVSVSFSFALDEGHVGDVMPCQVLLKDAKSKKAPDLYIKCLRIELNRGSTWVQIDHVKDESQKLLQQLSCSETQDNSRQLLTQADLDIRDDQSKALSLAFILKEAGELEVTSLVMECSIAGFDIHYTFTPMDLTGQTWLLEGEKRLIERSLGREDSLGVTVLPKPPRLQLDIADLRQQYFTSESTSLQVLAINEEHNAATGSIRIEAPYDILDTLQVRWSGSSTESDDRLVQDMSSISSSGERIFELSLQAPMDPVHIPLTIIAEYKLENDPETIVTKMTTFNFKFIRPFDAVFDLLPRLDTQVWPSYFSIQDQGKAEGFRQKWALSTRLTSRALEAVTISKIELSSLGESETFICDIPQESNETEISIPPSTSKTVHRDFFTQRKAIDDRHLALLDLQLKLTWRRPPSETESCTFLSVPSLELPPSEPRVLCTLVPATKQTEAEAEAGVEVGVQAGVEVEYILENPSMHFLTFTISIEASDSFAFSGPKVRNVSLAPLSRLGLRYRLLPLDVDGSPGKWIFPVLKVTDSYFNKTLRVSEAGEGVKGDDRRDSEQGHNQAVGIWIPGSEV